MEGVGYTEGPDLAPNAMPSAVSGNNNDEINNQKAFQPGLGACGASLSCLRCFAATKACAVSLVGVAC